MAIGDSFKDSRYTVVRKLGWGVHSTVWLAKDEQYDDLAVFNIFLLLISFPGATVMSR